MDTPRRLHARDFKRATDGDALRAFLAAAPRHLCLTLRAAAQSFESSKAWWSGAFDDEGNVKAVAWMEGKFVTMYSPPTDGDAIRTIAKSMLQQASGRPGRDGHTHHLFGPHHTISDFWDVFRALPRTVVGDRSPCLMSCSTPADLTGNTRVATATDADLRMVFEFTSDLAVEQNNPDPRRTVRQAHEKLCQDLIASGRQLFGTDAGKPSFIAELIHLGDDGALLNNLYIPRPFRRPAVIARLMAAAAKLALQRAPEVYTFCDDPAGPYAQGAAAAGFTPLADFRHLMLKGS
jgi:hypothetical protein